MDGGNYSCSYTMLGTQEDHMEVLWIEKTDFFCYICSGKELVSTKEERSFRI